MARYKKTSEKPTREHELSDGMVIVYLADFGHEDNIAYNAKLAAEQQKQKGVEKTTEEAANEQRVMWDFVYDRVVEIKNWEVPDGDGWRPGRWPADRELFFEHTPGQIATEAKVHLANYYFSARGFVDAGKKKGGPPNS